MGRDTGIFVALDVGGVSIEFDDFSDQFVVADLDELVHLGSAHAFCDDHWMRSYLRGPETLKILP